MKQQDINKTKHLFMESDCKEKISNKIVHINKNWIICILAIVVIILCAIIFTSQLFESKNVSLIISYTATILSIVLSLLAIFYSTIHNVESTSNLSEIRSAVAEIKATEDAMKNLMQNINQGVNSVNTNMAKISNQLSSPPVNVPQDVKNVSQPDADMGAVQEIENQLDT